MKEYPRKTIYGNVPQNKYRAKKVIFDGIVFDSIKERDRYIELRFLLQQGYISNLRRQVRFQLLPPVYEEKIKHLKTKTRVEKRLIQRKVEYVADFVYEINGKEVVEDTKGFRTKEYILKKKMMRALLGITIIEK